MLFFHISNMPQPSIQFLLLQMVRVFQDDSLYIKTFWIEGWGNRNIDDDKCTKMPIFSYYQKIEQIYMPVVHANSLLTMDDLVYIHSFDFLLIIYVTKIGQSVPQFIILINNRANFAIRGPFQNLHFSHQFTLFLKILLSLDLLSTNLKQKSGKMTTITEKLLFVLLLELKISPNIEVCSMNNTLNARYLRLPLGSIALRRFFITNTERKFWFE